MKVTAKRTRLLLATLLCVISFFNARATHIMGSDISYRCLGGNQYEVVVAVYRDCSGTVMPTSITVNVTSNCNSSSVICDLVDSLSEIEVSQLCAGAQSTCNSGSYPGVQLYTYVGLVTIQPGCGVYSFSYSDCCRNTSNNLVDNAPPSLGFSVEATLNSDLVNCDAAPRFTSLPVPYFCINQQVNYSHGSIDADGDSLVYKLIPPRDDASANLPYQGGYTAVAPMPTQSGFVFDAATGQMSFAPTQQGVYVVDVLVTEYRNGVVIGSTMRDIQIVIVNCTNNSPVVANCITNQNSSGGVVKDCNSLAVCPGSTLSFSIPGYDPDGDTLSVISNIATAIPGATLTTTYVGTGMDSLIATFTWTPALTDTGFRYFTIQFQDDACPIPGIQLFTYDISIYEATYAGIDRFYCTSGSPIPVHVVGGSNFSWSTTVGMLSAANDSSDVLLAPANTTTYIVISDLPGGCKDHDTVTIFTVPNFNLSITAADDTICLNQTTTLTANASPSNYGPFTYQWSPLTQGIVSPTQAVTDVKPNATTTYQVAVTSAAGCTITDTHIIAIEGIKPAVTVLASQDYVCPGSTVTLTGLISAVNCGPVADPQNACLPNSNYEIQDLGAGTDMEDVTPFRGFYEDGRVQYLYRASELQALGLNAGAITDIGFNVTSVSGSLPYSNFNVKMTCTDLSALPATFVTGLSPVINGATVPITTVGWTTHTLDIPYNWDGASNLIIEICFDNNDWQGGRDGVATSAAFNGATLWDETDGASGCSINFPTLSNLRPDTRFIVCEAPTNNYTFTWNASNGATLPGTPTVNATVNSNTNFELTVASGECQNSGSYTVHTDTSVQISAGNDFYLACKGDSAQLNITLLHEATKVYLPFYNSSNANSYAIIQPTGTVNAGPVGDDVVSTACTLPFPFTYFGNTYTDFYISTNGFITFTDAQGSGCCAGQYIPDNAGPNNVIALCWEDLNTTLGGTIDWFVNGTAPNRVAVVRFNGVVFFGSGGKVTGEIHMYESSNRIEIVVVSQNNPGQTNTLGIENSDGTFAYSPTGYNAIDWTVSSTYGITYDPVYIQNRIDSTKLIWTPSIWLNNDTIVNPVARPLATTQYVAQVTFTNGCVVYDTVNINVPGFSYTLTAQPDSVCPGLPSQLSFTTTNNVTYTWTPNVNLSSTTISNPVASPNHTTTYYVLAEDANGCNAVYDSVTVFTRGTPVSLGTDTSICPADAVTLAPNGGPYTSYTWSTGATSSTITTAAQATNSQQYWVVVNDGNCNIPSDTITVSKYVLVPPVITPAGDTGICVGGTITLYAAPGYATYDWTNGNTGSNITVNTSGYYSYAATDSNGCKANAVDSVFLTVNTVPVADIITERDTVCTGQNTQLYVTAAAGVDYYWYPGGIMADTFAITDAGTYYLTASNSGCTNVDSITVAAVAPPVVNLGDDQNVCSCDTTVVLTANVTGSYLWSGSQTTPSVTVTTTGVYTVTVTDEHSCIGVDSVAVNIRCLTANAYVADPASGTAFAGADATLNVDSISYGGNFNFNWTPATYLQNANQQQVFVQSPQATTTYTVQVTDAEYGCTTYDSVTLTVVPPGVPPMPNAFSPNGDGRNDVYGPYFPPSLQALYTITSFRIYNRWGQMVYNGNGYWDGTFKGEMQQAGTYLYYITVYGPDQNDPNVNINHNAQGSFTLLH